MARKYAALAHRQQRQLQKRERSKEISCTGRAASSSCNTSRNLSGTLRKGSVILQARKLWSRSWSWMGVTPPTPARYLLH